MNALLVDYDSFSMNSRIFVMQDGNMKTIEACSDLNELADMLHSFSHQYNLTDVKVSAPQHIFDELERIINQKYSTNNLKLEIM